LKFFVKHFGCKAVVCLEISNYAERKEREKKAATGAGAPVAGMSQIIY
jgi:hypothetical protein